MANIEKFDLEARASRLLTLADAKESGNKLSLATEFMANIAAQLAIPNSISVFDGRCYISNDTVIRMQAVL